MQNSECRMQNVNSPYVLVEQHSRLTTHHSLPSPSIHLVLKLRQ